MKREKKFKLKTPKGELAQNIQAVLPLIEEITQEKTSPLCLIGFSASEKDGLVKAHIATVSDDAAIESVLFTIMEQFLKTKKQLSLP